MSNNLGKCLSSYSWFSLWVLLFCGATSASIVVYEFETPEQETLFKTLIKELRCPKCQNQNIADSDAMVAKDIKDRVYEWVQEGRTEDEITGFLIDRYGSFVAYKPPLNRGTLILWFGPPLLFLIILVVIVVRVKYSATKNQNPVAEIPAEKVELILEKLKKKS